MAISREKINSAYRRIAPYIRHTPLLNLSDAFAPAASISLKLEYLQVAGSFKARGAFNNMLVHPMPASGVTAASGGNHGAAVAFAANKLGCKAHIFVPEIASPAKISKIRQFGATITVKGARFADALALCEAYARQTGALAIHAYDSAATIAGQGTVGLEWEQDLRGDALDVVLVAVGGGGLIAGIASWFEAPTRIIGVEPTRSCALRAALDCGHPVEVEVDSLAADSLGARIAGDFAFKIAHHRVDQVVLVDDRAIRDAQKTLWNQFRIAVEPGGAAAFAAIASGSFEPPPAGRIGILLCGANVDLHSLADVAARN